MTVVGSRVMIDILKRVYPQTVAEAFVFDFGPPAPPLTQWQRVLRRVARASLALREWLAVNVLRVQLRGDE